MVGDGRYSDQEKSFRYGRLPVPGSTSGVTPPAVAGLNGVTGTFARAGTTAPSSSTSGPTI